MTRIGVTQRVEVVEEYGERRDCLDQAWVPLFESFGLTAVPLPNTVEDVKTYLTELNLSGLVLTGGNDLDVVSDPENPAPERDRFERSALKVARDRHWPVLGVCRGLQLVNVFYGGSIDSVEGHIGHPHEVDFADWLDLPETATVNSYHGYGIRGLDLAAELDPVGIAADDTIEAVRHSEWDLVAVMWHPERDDLNAIDEEIITAMFGDLT